MDSTLGSHREVSLLGLPIELRLLIYARLMDPVDQYKHEDYTKRQRHRWRAVWEEDVPKTKFVYSALHALSASCSMLHGELVSPIEEVRDMLSRQKYCSKFDLRAPSVLGNSSDQFGHSRSVPKYKHVWFSTTSSG